MQKRHDGSYLFFPTDLVNFLSCSHSTVLDPRSFTDTLERGELLASDALLQRNSIEHETASPQILKDDGNTVVEISGNLSIAERSRHTKETMSASVDAI